MLPAVADSLHHLPREHHETSHNFNSTVPVRRRPITNILLAYDTDLPQRSNKEDSRSH